MGGPTADELTALYPSFRADERKEAWIDDNRAKIKEAMTIFMAFHPDGLIFPADVSIEPSGSLFVACEPSFYVPIFWNPSTIMREHEGFIYTVFTPGHVAALHAFRHWMPALAYFQAHYDSRMAPQPLVSHVPAIWYPDVFPFQTHPDEVPGAPYDPIAFPTWRDA
ncbi:hypothetical protein B0H19DRAFT_1248057 [Mycena capillaripes]|nr:hypothetical protein B0H19DRAFT_1248057 [Mycena capillaripes]